MPNRDGFPTCPDCGIALDEYGRRLTCDRCGGVLVTEAELLELLTAIDPEHPRALRWPELERPSRRSCPCCTAIMTGARMEGVPVERCVAHGVWFDKGELAKVLAPDADAEEFAHDYQVRQGRADRFEGGALGSVIRDILRGRKRRD